MKNRVLSGIKRITGLTCEFSPDVEAYMYYSEADLRIWPYLASDVYLTTAVYETETRTVRHAATNAVLFTFKADGVTAVTFEDTPYLKICHRAYMEFLKPHNQRQSERDARGWLTWLIGEYIKDELNETPVRLSSVIREGVTA